MRLAKFELKKIERKWEIRRYPLKRKF